jgi:hypothetical protein
MDVVLYISMSCARRRMRSSASPHLLCSDEYLSKRAASKRNTSMSAVRCCLQRAVSTPQSTSAAPLMASL